MNGNEKRDPGDDTVFRTLHHSLRNSCILVVLIFRIAENCLGVDESQVLVKLFLTIYI